MADSILLLPVDFDEYEWEVEAKGYFTGAKLTLPQGTYALNFFDPVRLAQEIEGVLSRGAIFFEPNLLVIPVVTRCEMERAAKFLADSTALGYLVRE